VDNYLLHLFILQCLGYIPPGLPHPHGLLEEIVEYDGTAIKDALYELGVGYSDASGTIT